MIEQFKKPVLIMMALAIVAGPALAQAYSSAGTWTSGGGQVTGGGVSAGPGGVKTFSLGSGFMYSITSVSPNDAQQLQNQGVRVVTVPAGKTLYVTSQTGQPLDIKTGDQGVMPNTIVFGPGRLRGHRCLGRAWHGCICRYRTRSRDGRIRQPGRRLDQCRARSGRKRTDRRRCRRRRRLDRHRAGHRDHADVLVHRQRGRGIPDHPAVRR